MLAIRKVKLLPLLGALAGIALLIAAIVTSSRYNRVLYKAEELNTFDVQEPAAPALVAADAPPPPEKPEPGDGSGSGEMAAMTPVEVTVPKLAYAYDLGFRLPGDKIAAAQDAHRSACAKMGAARCQLLGMSRGSADDSKPQAHLKLRIASAEAQRFSDDAVRAVARSGGRAIKTSVTAEDVSKQIVDAEARIHQRELLVSRLTEILRTRSGKVEELVDTERSIAEAQEELDKTKGWLTELRGRVAMSDFDIDYEAIAPATTPDNREMQLGEAVSDSASSFAIALKGLAMLLIYLTPWLLILGPIAWFGIRKLRRAGQAPTSDPDRAIPAPESEDA